MANTASLKLGVINVRLTHGSPQKYVDLFNALDRLEPRPEAKIRGRIHGTLSTVFKQSIGADAGPLYGTFIKFRSLDRQGQWVNTNRGIVLEEESGEKPTIPAWVEPEGEKIAFAFFPDVHKLVVDASKLSINSSHAFFKGIFDLPSIKTAFGPVFTTVEPDRETLEKIIDATDSASFLIYIERPNADNQKEREILDWLEARGAHAYKEKLISDPEGSINLDADLKEKAYVAASNGYVESRVRKGRRRVTLSTKDEPLIKIISYDPATLDVYEAILALGGELAREVSRRKITGD